MYDYIKLKSVPQPIRDLVLVKRGEVEESTTEGGIILPNTSRRLDNSGEVVALGDYGRITKKGYNCLLYTSPSPRDKRQSRMPSSA